MRMRADGEAGGFDAREDLPVDPLLDRIWLDDGKGSFHIRSIICCLSA